MYSIIVCSIDPASAERLRRNVAETIGVPFEFLTFDNRGTGRGICSVYNECARRAKYDLLCFAHEDILFLTRDWGHALAAKLAEPECGVVGFAGGTVKTREMTGWCLQLRDTRRNYYQPGLQGPKHVYTNPRNADFAPVICLDGFCQLCRREVWAASPFDEQTLTGFHAYDLDFTTAAAGHYRNYVCNTVGVEHLSAGKYTLDWLHWMEVYHAKWRAQLPLFAEERPSEARIARLEREAGMLKILKLIRLGLFSRRDNLRMAAGFIRRNPFYRLSWLLAFKTLRYELLGRK